MKFLNKLATDECVERNTTRNFYVGAPEAEAETTTNSKIKLGEIFSDYLNVIPELDSEKFIITGRKGSGKTAIAEYILFSADNDPNSFCDFIKTRDLDCSRIVQLGKEQGLPIEEKLLYEWIILTKFIKLFTEDQSVQSIKEFKDLKVFLTRNSGLVDIKDYEVEEIIRKKSFEVNIEYFKRVFSSMFKREVGIKEHKAPFYKILRPLQEIVIKLLKENTSSDNEYYLIFDDLDIGFNEKDTQSVENITNILRVSKDYNIDFFGKNGLNAKVIILLRDDIKRIVGKYNADTAKLFSSYEIPLIWYEHANFKKNENLVGLKKLINKRIAINFEKENISYFKADPWQTLFVDDAQFSGSSFKYLIDYTLFRPRDLILLFKPLPKNAFNIPLSFQNAKSLVNSYVEELVLEIKNELSASFTASDITKIFTILKRLKTKQPLKKSTIINEFENVGLEYDHESALYLLFEYSLLGNIDDFDPNSIKIFFKHRERIEEPCVINCDLKFIYHKAIEVYFDKREF